MAGRPFQRAGFSAQGVSSDARNLKRHAQGKRRNDLVEKLPTGQTGQPANGKRE